MRHVFVTALAALGMVGSACAAAGAAAPLTLETTWSVALDASGHVVGVEQSSQIKPLLADPLAKAIRGWEFEPGRVDGKPAPTETTLYLDVTLEPGANDSYAVRVDGVRTGGAVSQIKAPVFPTSLLQHKSVLEQNSAALVVVEAHYDQDGKVVSVAPAPGAPKVQKALSKAVMTAVKGWTFTPERVAGHGVAAGAYVPVCFAMAANGADCGKWSPLAGADIGNGVAFALEPAATLKSDVIGRTL